MNTNEASTTPEDSDLGGLVVAAGIAEHTDSLIKAMHEIELWVRRHAADIDRYSYATESRVALWPALDSVEAYHRLASALPEIVPTDDLDSIEHPTGDRPWIAARIGPVPVTIYAPVGACERVQVGTKVIEVADPDAPKKAVEVPVYEYRCTDGIEGTA